ncbi:unnamed protein product [Polarella glacialis]|uniref:Uncharacterized protein n=1 Tax=Polarella glacialis TaxID=89957 RepID=A0A813KW65_POLGL|nr:unnamed protein product [Polarella glacialis]
MSQAYFEAWKADPFTVLWQTNSIGRPTMVSFPSMPRTCCSKPLAAAVEAWPTFQCFCPANTTWEGNTFPVTSAFQATLSTCASALRIALLEDFGSYYMADTITPVAAVGPKLTVLLQPPSSCKAEQDSMPPAAYQASRGSPGARLARRDWRLNSSRVLGPEPDHLPPDRLRRKLDLHLLFSDVAVRLAVLDQNVHLQDVRQSGNPKPRPTAPSLLQQLHEHGGLPVDTRFGALLQRRHQVAYDQVCRSVQGYLPRGGVSDRPVQP